MYVYCVYPAISIGPNCVYPAISIGAILSENR
jgi:hypothetical protein